MYVMKAVVQMCVYTWEEEHCSGGCVYPGQHTILRGDVHMSQSLSVQ